VGILLASFRSEVTCGITCYRAIFLAPQVLAAWVLTEQWQQPNPGCAADRLLLILGWFLPWYLARYSGLDWPEIGVFKTLGLGLASVALYLLWEWARNSASIRNGL
jgi:hypothetical protein